MPFYSSCHALLLTMRFLLFKRTALYKLGPILTALVCVKQFLACIMREKEKLRGTAAILLLCLSQTCARWCLRAASRFFLSENTLSFSHIDMAHSCASLHSVESFSFVQFQKLAYFRLRWALGSNMLTCKFFVQQPQRLFLLSLHSLKQQYNVTANVY